LTIEKLAASFKESFKNKPAMGADVYIKELALFLEGHKLQMLAELEHGQFKCKLPEVERGSITFSQFNERFLKPRVPMLVKNAVTPRNISWFTAQKCLESGCTHNINHKNRDAFWSFYKTHIDPSHKKGSVKINAVKYFEWLSKHYDKLVKGDRGLNELGVMSPAIIYYFELQFILGCPNLVREFAPPEFMQDNWAHALQMVCSEIEELPDIKVGPRGTGATCHLDSMHAEAYSMQLFGRKVWMLGDYYNIKEGNFTSLCMHVQQPGTLIHVPRKFFHSTHNLDFAISAQADWFNRDSIPDMVSRLQVCQ
jgi:hypothetical protein